jgi:UDP-2-acetamido-3-amino-2,3-dideoxy-glucuronate N-acetyltransferase
MTSSPMDAGSSIHPTAIVEEGALLGEGVQIWHHSHVRSGARIGAGCMLGKNVFVDSEVVLGKEVRVQNNVSIYSGVIIEDEVFIGPSAVFTNDRKPRSSGDWTLETTLIRKGASIGANSTLVAPVEIGSWALVAAGAVVLRDVREYEVVGGNPAGSLGWICRCAKTTVSFDAIELSCSACGTLLSPATDS